MVSPEGYKLLKTPKPSKMRVLANFLPETNYMLMISLTEECMFARTKRIHFQSNDYFLLETKNLDYNNKIPVETVRFFLNRIIKKKI